MILLPLITIALLSNAFKQMMDTANNIGNFKVGYRINTNSTYKELFPELVSTCKSEGVTLQEFPEGDISDLLENNTIAVFVDVKDDNYKIYQSSDKKLEASITESIFHGFFYQINDAKTSYEYAAKKGISLDQIPKEVNISRETLAVDPVPSSTVYYGIIYIVYFAWCGMVSLIAVISSERKSAIPRRMLVSHMPKLNYYLGKFLPCTAAIFLEVCAAWILSIFLYGIHWGNIGLSLLIIFLISVCSSTFGIVLFQLFNNVAISIVLGFIITWIWGFFGGTFQTYMYAHLPQQLVSFSPIYYINRTLVEYSTMGHSNYTGKCLFILIGCIIFFGLAGILLMNRKLEEQE
jgi:ABC-2 type transport system permease protein